MVIFHSYVSLPEGTPKKKNAEMFSPSRNAKRCAELAAWCVPVPVMPNLHQQICLKRGMDVGLPEVLRYPAW